MIVTVSVTFVARFRAVGGGVTVAVALLESVIVLVFVLADVFIEEMVVFAGMPVPVTPSPILRFVGPGGFGNVTRGEPATVEPLNVMVVAVAALESVSVVALVTAVIVVFAGMPKPTIGSPAAKPVVLETVTTLEPVMVVPVVVCA